MPKVTGRMLHEGVAKWSFWISFIGSNLAFGPMHLLGLWGMPRRTYTYEAGLGWGSWNMLETIGAFLFGIGLVIALANFLWSLRHGEPAGPNPWGGGTLEWATTSPPPDYNFAQSPIVTDRNPLWVGRDEPADDAPGDQVTDPDLALAPPELEHELFLTTGPEAGLEQVREMPGPSFAPLWVALSLTAVSAAMLLQSAVFGAVSIALLVASVVGWYWPKGDVA
jgi:cytochrome c oxidase subunit 1/cytochrome c oxidase subunit I+III